MKNDSLRKSIEDKKQSIFYHYARFDLYVASKLISNPNAEKEIDPDNKFFFPLHRIRSIMKQDTFYAPKTEAVTAMARAT